MKIITSDFIDSKMNTIIHGDCLETMKQVPDNYFDVIITSPPYNKAGFEGFLRKRHSSDSWKQRNVDYGKVAENDFMDEEKYKEWQIDLLNEMHRIIKHDGSIFYNHKIRIANHGASHPIEWILKSNANFRQQITWDRSNSPAVAPIRYLPSTELIFWLTKGKVQPNFTRNKQIDFLGEVWKISAKSNPNHPAPFPIEIPLNILPNISGNIKVFDPFMGSGTVAKACKELGLVWCGCELEPDYVAIANKRLEAVQGSLF